jgi:hypothetical protein
LQKLEFLYYFSCESLVVLEAKILGLDEGTPPDQVYHWLCYERSSGQFEKLTFKAMDTKDDKNFREFAQAELSFDTANARLQIRAQEFILTVHKANSVPDQFTSHVQQFLLG